MKARHVEAERQNALAILALCNIGPDQNFHTLYNDQVCSLLEQADLARYRKPRNANGSRARYFHNMLQRRAARKAVQS